LFLAAIESFNAEGSVAVFERQVSGDYVADMRTLARVMHESMLREYDGLRLLMCESDLIDEVREGAAAGSASNHARLAGYFRQQIAAGVVRADLDPEVLAHASDALFSTAAFYRRGFGSEIPATVDDETLLDQLADLFVQGTRQTAEK
ncbi:MAG: hypothetical protein GYB65_03405, partial [Chloroflexi bacterium]|nr:hypothetical protein [Chloroflexota bacterium]